MTGSVARTVARDRRPLPSSSASARQLVNAWHEKEALGAERVDAFVVILRTRGCYWADLKGCSMCGYARDTLGRSATPEELADQLRQALRAYRGEPYVKVYTSGSFLDDREVDSMSRAAFVSAFSGRARRLLFETLPEFVTPERVNPLREAFVGELEIALGLESTQPEILRRMVNKGAPPSDYLAAARRVRDLGALPKAYLLLKPPYLTEREAVADVVRSIEVAAPYFDTLSVNPVHIQNGTVVDYLFRRRQYRPPWLWSLAEVLRRGAALAAGSRLVSFPTAGGLPRGPHNCGECDASVLAAIEEASLSQHLDVLDSANCACRARWETEGAVEPMGFEA